MSQPGRSPSILRRIFAVKEFGVFLILALMVVAMSLITDSFSTKSNFISILQAISPIAIMAIGQTFVILTGGIDLSVGSVCALSAYLMSLVLTREAGASLGAAMLTALATGGLCGLLTGLIITRLRVTPFIVTLGMLSACSGLTLGLSGGKQIGLTKFGVPTEMTASILSPTGEVSGQPSVERRFYSESGRVDKIAANPLGGIWAGASQPGHVSLLDASWTEKVSVSPEGLDEIRALLPQSDGSLIVGGVPGKALFRITPSGETRVIYQPGAEAIVGLIGKDSESFWVAASEPDQIVEIKNDGTLARPPINLGLQGRITSLQIGARGQLLVATSQPAEIIRIDPDTSAQSSIYSSTAETIENLQMDDEGNLWFIEGGQSPDHLMCLTHGKPVEIWKTPKPPIRDYIVFPGSGAIASVGNVGAIFLIRPGLDARQIHPMTTHKARCLAWQGDHLPILVGNSGPGGVATLETVATKTVYPLAESFNSLFEYAPPAMLVLVILGWLFLRFTKWGTYLYAIGGNEQAARLSGIKVGRMKILSYTVTGILCGLAGIFLTSKLHTLDPNLAKGYELKVIAAVVIGGTSLNGGEGSVWGTLIGAALLFVLNYALVHLGMEDIWSDLFIGVVIILAAVIDSLRTRLPELLLALGLRKIH